MVRLVGVLAAVLIVVSATVIGVRTWAAGAQSVAVGLVDGDLAACGSPLNCVSTSGPPPALVEPIICVGADPLPEVREVVGDLGWHVAEDRDVDGGRYLHVVATTRVLRFRDDVELLVVPGDDWIRVRSASRLGTSDLGANQARVDGLRAEFDRRCS